MERPSDWVLRRLGLAAGLDVDALDYRAPAGLQAATAALFLAGGGAVAVALQALLGDATWSVSTGAPRCARCGACSAGLPIGDSRHQPATCAATSPPLPACPP